ncbi:MAG TPA: hypothetical protein DEP66_04025 [Acidimicrobiaceae bacterium]|nr:hypothetical protein [Acidimicrobiaceae bacterium]HCB37373.1 hypothetical protein [Acidimicrobiaceae bacterium]
MPTADDGRRKGRYRNAKVDRAAGGVVLRDDRVLVVHRPRYDDWSLPKGHVDGGETFVEAALREVREETGVAAEVVGGPYPVAYLLGSGVPKVVVFFPMRGDDGADPAAADPDEVDDVRWWEPDEARRRLSYGVELEALNALVPERLRGPLRDGGRRSP